MGFGGTAGKIEKRRAVVLGLDGVSYSMLVDLMAKGMMPYTRALCQQGQLHKMEGSIPEVSSVSWTTFMTGKNPGEHGIYGFMDVVPGTYELYFPNAENIKADTIWSELAKGGKRSVIINLPSTYPAQPMDGVLISGFVAIDLNKSVYPKSYIPRLESLGYRIDLDTVRARKDEDFLFRALTEFIDIRKKAVEFFWDEIDWDLFIAAITGTDRLHHFQMHAYADENNANHKRFLNYYRQVDDFIRWFHQKSAKDAGKENLFLMLSDHGFTQIITEVYLNRVLLENGYLKFKTADPATIQDIGEDSKAFCLDPSRIYINLADKYPKGVVATADYKSLREELKQLFLNLAFRGEQVMRSVYFKEEIYTGPHLESAPDLILLSYPGFDLKGAVGKDTIFAKGELTGMHTQDDAFCFLNNNYSKVKNIVELKNIILAAIL